MKQRILAALILIAFIPISCTTVPLSGTSPVTTTGQDLNSLAAQATQAFADYKAGNANYAWAAAQALQAYQTISKTKGDVEVLIRQWTGSGTFAQKLASIFAASSAPPQAKLAALANGVSAGAATAGSP